ncbi:hypothetical protein L208DRAFT_1378117 [Tricholoma matsutake]|nr:hypothetical protein L208DRAFT_1378117 [Tricholoma matsutake 945]
MLPPMHMALTLVQSEANHISNENESFGQNAPQFSPVPFTYEWIMSPDWDHELEDTPSPPPLLPGREMIECANCHDFFDVGVVVAGQGGPGCHIYRHVNTVISVTSNYAQAHCGIRNLGNLCMALSHSRMQDNGLSKCNIRLMMPRAPCNHMGTGIAT